MTEQEEYQQYLKEQEERAEYEQYLASQQGAGLANMALPQAGPKILQEQHPDVGLLERAKLKTFGNSPESMAKALMQNPNLEAAVDPKTQQVIVRTKGAPNWNVLDPDTGIDVLSMDGFKELGKDALEGMYDVGTGIVEGVGATAAGVAAGAGTGGVAAIPAAMGAGAALGAGNEALRQKIGAYLGIPQEVNGDDVMMSGAFGAASPLLFGTGKAVKSGAQNALKDELFQSGVLGTAGKKTLAKGAEVMTGIRGELFNRAAKNPELMKSIADQGEDVVANNAIEGLYRKMDDNYQTLGTRINDELRNSGEMIDISETKNQIKKTMEKIEKGADGKFSAEDKNKLNALTDLFNKTFKRSEEVNDDVIENMMDSSGQLITNPVTGLPVQKLTQTTKEVQKELPDMVDASEAFKIKEELTNAADFMSDKFRSNKSQSDKTVSTVARGAYGKTKAAIEDAIEVAPELNKEYKETLSDIDFLKSKFKNPKIHLGEDLAFDEKGANQLYKIGNGNRQMTRKVGQLDKKYGTNLLDDAENITASRLNQDASYFTPSVGGVTSTSRAAVGQALGGATGAFIGSQVSDEPESLGGYAKGAAIGALMTSPRAFMNYLKMAEKASKIPAGARESAWNLLMNKEQ